MKKAYTSIVRATLFLFIAASTLAAMGAETKKPANDYDTLRATKLFAIGGIGFVGSVSPGEKALRIIQKQPDGAAQFQRLLSEATNEGQLYALIGLRTLDEKAFEAAMPSYLKNTNQIQVMHGCLLFKKPVKEIAREIQTGKLK